MSDDQSACYGASLSSGSSQQPRVVVTDEQTTTGLTAHDLETEDHNDETSIVRTTSIVSGVVVATATPLGTSSSSNTILSLPSPTSTQLSARRIFEHGTPDYKDQVRLSATGGQNSSSNIVPHAPVILATDSSVDFKGQLQSGNHSGQQHGKQAVLFGNQHDNNLRSDLIATAIPIFDEPAAVASDSDTRFNNNNNVADDLAPNFDAQGHPKPIRNDASTISQLVMTCSVSRNKIYMLLALIVIIAVAGITGALCAAGKCAASKSLDDHTLTVVAWINEASYSTNPIQYPPINRTPEELALKWIIERDPWSESLYEKEESLSEADQFRLAQRYALLVLWFQDESSVWYERRGWLEAEDECNWHGIICESRELRRSHGIERVDVVTEVLLSANNIGGFPSDLALLEFLQRLDLSGNGLVGPLPTSLADMTSLRELQLSDNSLSGTLSDNLGALTDLIDLDFSTNFLSGTLPPAIGNWTSLEYFGTYRNERLSGSLPTEVGLWSSIRIFDICMCAYNSDFPTEIGAWSRLSSFLVYQNDFVGLLPHHSKWTMLKEFVVFDNAFTGSLSSTNLEGWRALTHFIAGDNVLSGSLPPALGEWTQLIDFQIQNNVLTGSLPPSIGQWKRLKNFMIQDNSISGSIPANIADWFTLEQFWASINLLTGSIPSALSQWQQLEAFFVDTNQLTSSVPQSLGEWTKLESFIVFGNDMSGTIPPTIGAWSNLVEFDIGSNRFLNGTIPASFGHSWPNLTEFWMNECSFSGTLPTSIGQWTNLELFLARSNLLSGSFPNEIGNWTNLRDLDLHSNSMDGTLPDSISAWTNLQSFAIGQNSFEGSMPEFLATWSKLEEFWIDDNEFTGTLPLNIFDGWTNLVSMNVHNNLLVGTIPSALCTLDLSELWADCIDEITCTCCTECF